MTEPTVYPSNADYVAWHNQAYPASESACLVVDPDAGPLVGPAEQPSEPLIHSHVRDGLPDNHPLAYTQIHCRACQIPVHAGNNECMQTWVETGRGPHCLPCFAKAPTAGTVIAPEWGLS